MPPGGKAYFGPHCLDLPAQGGLLVVRHSARPPILTPQAAYHVGLTNAGRKMARKFGESLGKRWRLGEVVASPAPRCLQTAGEIVRGALGDGQPLPAVRPLPVLHFDQKLTGIAGLAGIYLNDHGFTALVCSPESYEYQLLKNTLLTNLQFPEEPGTLNLAATHDVVVTFLQASLLGLPGASVEDFPGYLEGVCLVRENGKIRLW